MTHLFTEGAEKRIWVIGCHYTIGLVKRRGEWRICASRAEIQYEEGDRRLEAEARLRAAALPH